MKGHLLLLRLGIKKTIDIYRKSLTLSQQRIVDRKDVLEFQCPLIINLARLWQKFFFIIIVLITSVSCTKKPSENTPTDYYKPQIGDTFEWRLDSITLGEVNQYSCKIIDIDAFTTTKELVAAFHARGIKVIAYISVGTLETYRPDSNLLPSEVIGNIYPAWPDERFLDIRQIEKLKPFITSRFDMIKAKGFDGIESDNIDIYGEVTDFNLTLEDTKIFCEWIIDEAHKRGLCIGQKNTEELVPMLYKKFDWALTENIFHQNNQNDYSPYISNGKPVFSAEYTDAMDILHFNTFVCNKALQLKYFAFLKHKDLNQWTYECK